MTLAQSFERNKAKKLELIQTFSLESVSMFIARTFSPVFDLPISNFTADQSFEA